ncbi:MAG TPA: hypothetical protein VLU24_08980, partial [Mycobacterium sp.]|nr:hypothetical protein [Mycobacterium sp.]
MKRLVLVAVVAIGLLTVAPASAAPTGSPVSMPVADIPIGPGTGTGGVAVNDSTGRVYVANGLAGTVSVIDGRTNRVVATIPLPGLNPSKPFLAGPGSFAIDEPANTIYVLNND